MPALVVSYLLYVFIQQDEVYNYARGSVVQHVDAYQT